jgi:HK97 family phage portal protein
MRRSYRKSVIAGGVFGQKAVTLQDVDNFLEWMASESGDSSAQELYKVVAWVFWCVGQRAKNIAQIPYLILPMEVEEDDKDLAVEWGIDLSQTLWAIEAWLRLKGAAYILKVQEQGTLNRLQVLNANTMSVKTWDDTGQATSFEQKIGAKRRQYPAEDIVYFRLFNPTDDIREGTSSGEVGQQPATIIKNINRYGGSFFENGAIPAVLLTTDGPVPPRERERVEGEWNKMLRGVANAFRTMVLGHGLTPQVIGQTNADLAMPELEKSKKEQILAAYGVPPGLSEPRTNYAERMALQYEFWDQYLIPDTKVWIVPPFNEQLFNLLGLRLSPQYQQVEAMQWAEGVKSESLAFTAQTMLSYYDKNLVSVDEARSWLNYLGLSSNMPPLDDSFTPEARIALEKEQVPELEEETEGPGTLTPIDERIESRMPKALLDDLGRWERKAVTRIKEGFPAKALEFSSDAIPAVMHRMIVHSLEHAATIGDVLEVFKSARGESKQIHFIPEGQGEPLPPVPNEVNISDADIDRAIRDWNRHMPDFVGLLEAEVIHRENYDDA